SKKRGKLGRPRGEVRRDGRWPRGRGGSRFDRTRSFARAPVASPARRSAGVTRGPADSPAQLQTFHPSRYGLLMYWFASSMLITRRFAPSHSSRRPMRSATLPSRMLSVIGAAYAKFDTG